MKYNYRLYVKASERLIANAELKHASQSHA